MNRKRVLLRVSVVTRVPRAPVYAPEPPTIANVSVRPCSSMGPVTTIWPLRKMKVPDPWATAGLPGVFANDAWTRPTRRSEVSRNRWVMRN